MTAFYRAATIAAVTFSTALGIAGSAPSFAETVTTAVSTITNEQILPPVPSVEPLPEAPLVDRAPAESGTDVPAALAPVPLPKAATLAQLVARQPIPDQLDREAECLAVSVFFESRSEPFEGQLAVAEVVLNRANSGGRFPSSICKVVMQKGQFSFVRGGGFPPINRASRDWREAVAIAQIAINDAWDSRAANALFFHATHVSPRWKRARVAQLGNHIFYR